MAELVDGLGRGDDRGLRPDLDGGALRENAIKVDPADTDAAADTDGGKLVLVYPLSGLPGYADWCVRSLAAH